MTAIPKESSIAGLVEQWQRIAGISRSTVPAQSALGLESRRSTPVQPTDPKQCLVDMLVAAAKLEFATIPPYLCALWSIENEIDPVAESIREVVQEEMLHLALVCNLLAAIGVQPQLRDWAPTYPTALPGGVHVGMEVWLQGLNKASLATFIRIESPESKPDNVDFEEGDPFWGGGDTIGVLYESILAAFRYLKPDLNTDVQVTGPLSWRAVATLADVEWAIRIIQHQGEGAVIGPLDSSKADLAHYYRFLEIWKGKRLGFDEADRRFHWRGKLKFPDCRPMGPVPKGGYADPLPSIVIRHLKQFDQHYETMLTELENAWSSPVQNVTTGQGALIHAYVQMFELAKHARPLMAIPIGDSKGPTYGPQFSAPVKTSSLTLESRGRTADDKSQKPIRQPSRSDRPRRNGRK